MTEKTISLIKKLSNIQCELKAPKNQYNKFGKYNYRNCEDILEAVKPLCNKNKATLVISDQAEIYDGWHYIKAVAELHDWESDQTIKCCAYARESATRKGMDESQITGSTSSYARKYALNGLFNIDDTKDADTNEQKEQQNNKNNTEEQLNVWTLEWSSLRRKMEAIGIDYRSDATATWLKKHFGIVSQDASADLQKMINLVNAYKALIQEYEKKYGQK